jgi:hypothetical protein
MKKEILGLLLISSLLFPSSAKAKPNNQTIQGKQYIVLNSGARSISDNPILYRFCNSKYECRKIELKYIQAIEKETDAVEKIRHISNIINEFSDYKVARSVNTDFDGNYSFKCPTSECLIFSLGNAGLARAYWLKTVKSNSKVDLTVSNAIFVQNKGD